MAAEKKNINSVIKSLKVLECFSREVKELKLIEISKIMDIPKSTASNLIYTLVDMGYLEQNSENGKFRLGIKLFMLGKVYEYHFNLIDMARPYMEELRNRFNEAVLLSAPYESSGVWLEKIEGERTLAMNSQEGKLLPLYCTASGKLFLSAMTIEKLKRTLGDMELVKRADNTITDPGLLIKELDVIRERGYSVAVDENEIGITSIAAPIYNYKNELIASISLAGPTARLPEKLRQEIIMKLVDTAEIISKKSGCSK